MNERFKNEIEKIKSMSLDELFSIKSSYIKSLIEELGKNEMNINSKFREGNNWNSEVENIYILNGRVYVTLYVQNLSTDTSMSDLFDKFFIRGRYVSSNNRLDAKVVYNVEDKAECLKSILIQFAYHKYSDEARKSEIIAKVGHYTITNPICDYFYRKYDLWHSHIGQYSSRNEVVIYEGYYYAKKKLNQYIEENYLDLNNKNKDELETIYKKVFGDAMTEFDKTFDFNEWREKRYYI